MTEKGHGGDEPWDEVPGPLLSAIASCTFHQPNNGKSDDYIIC